MSNFLFFSVLRALSNGRVIRALMTFLLRVLSILTLAGGLYLLYNMVTGTFHEGAPTELVLYGILAILIFVVTMVAVAQIFWFRANSVQEIPDGPFTAIPVFSVLLRAIGEIYACVITTLGILVCLLIWIAKGEGRLPPISLPGLNLPNVHIENSFLQGLVFLLFMLLMAAGALLLFYFLAEAIVVTVDIAVNIRAFLRSASPAPVPVAPQPPYVPQPPVPYGPPQPPVQYGAPQPPPYATPQAPSTALRCPNCGNEVAPGAPFCPRCGTPLSPQAPAR
jgi:hypothetical protein